MKVQTSSGATDFQRASHSAVSRASPRAARSSSEIASSLEPVIRTTCSSSGRRSRTARIFSICSSSSTMTTLASEFSSTYWHSSGELVW